MKIGEAVASIEFSDAEKDRVGEALRDPNSLPHRVLLQQVAEIHDQDFWRRYQKAFDIHGFRWGAPPARQLVLRKALESIKTHAGHEARPIWRFYRSCIIEFVIRDFPALNDLLLNEELLDDERPLTDRVFASIRRALPLYDVPEEQVRQFYLLWGFERASNFESILRDDSLTASIAKRLVERESQTLTGLLTDRIAELGEDLRINSDTDIAARLEELRGRVDKLTSAVSETGDLHRQLAEVTEKIVALEGRLEPASTAITVSSLPGEPAGSTHDDNTTSLLKERLETLTTTVSRHEKYLQGLSPATRAHPTGGSTNRDGQETWGGLLGRVRANCRKAGFELKHTATARIMLELIRRSRVICCDDSKLWVNALTAYGTPDIRWESASPLWVEAQDWHEAITFISDHNASRRVLVLMDFEVGLQEAYLLPALRTWIASIPRACEHRLILVAADASFAGVSSRVLEACLAIPSGSDLIGEVERLVRGVDESLSARWHQIAPSQPFAYEETSNSEFEQQVKKLFENHGATLPAALAREFTSLMHGVQDFIGESAAALIASECSLLPWYRRTRGEGATRLLKETLTSIYGVA